MRLITLAAASLASLLVAASAAQAQTVAPMTIKDGNQQPQPLCEFKIDGTNLAGCGVSFLWNGSAWGKQPTDASFRPYFNLFNAPLGSVVDLTSAGQLHQDLIAPISCRATTIAPTAGTDGQAMPIVCGTFGVPVFELGSPETFRQRGAANTATTTAQAFTGWATPSAGQSAYITDIECHREDNAQSGAIHATLNDTASTPIGLPYGSGDERHQITPYRVSTAGTAPTFTLSAAVTGGNVYCEAQGYNR